MSRLGIGRHAPRERLARHRHRHGYVALVLAGGYQEAGDGGRIAAEPGTVLVHGDHSTHLDCFGKSGAEVLNLPRSGELAEGAGRVADPDAVARLAERDLIAASELARETFHPDATRAADWPDLLAAALGAGPDLRLSDWAETMGLDRASVSRGFARVYGVSPKRFRLEARARRAALALGRWPAGLAALAAEHGFADQAHMTRAVVALTGEPPGALRAKSVQAGGDPRA